MIKSFGGYDLDDVARGFDISEKNDILTLHNVSIAHKQYDVRWNLRLNRTKRTWNEWSKVYSSLSDPELCIPSLSIYSACVAQAYASDHPKSEKFANLILEGSRVGVLTATHLKPNGQFIEYSSMAHNLPLSMLDLQGNTVAWRWITGKRSLFLFHNGLRTHEEVPFCIDSLDGGIFVGAKNIPAATHTIWVRAV